ncbi:hypothetical protein VNO77_24549 [Canavalia gladiata]|uniref:Uncharacterized protein n=1 Tax=Canavalia gladiata TaxID=3824 RepID=A0AAN9L6G9_CANGL
MWCPLIEKRTKLKMGAEGGNACPHTSHTTLELSLRIDSSPISVVYRPSSSSSYSSSSSKIRTWKLDKRIQSAANFISAPGSNLILKRRIAVALATVTTTLNCNMYGERERVLKDNGISLPALRCECVLLSSSRIYEGVETMCCDAWLYSNLSFWLRSSTDGGVCGCLIQLKTMPVGVTTPIFFFTHI